MWGDYLTDSLTEQYDLARMQRTLTGVNGVYDNSSTRAQVFAAQQSDARNSEEIRGNGTALLFQLTGAPIVPNSEVIELIVRDRDNPGLVLQTTPLLRFTDYTLDSVTGNLSFANVVPSVDADLNPIFVRISYDRTSSLDEHIVAGFRLQQQIAESSRIGLSVTDDQNPLTGFTLAGVHAQTRLGLHTKLTAAAATQQHRDDREQGYAQQFQLEHTWQGRPDFRSTFTYGQASNTFDNPSAGIGNGRKEFRLEHRQPLGNTLKATAEVIRSDSSLDATHFSSAGAKLEKKFSSWSLAAGARHVRSEDANESLSFNTVLLDVEKQFKLGGARHGSIGTDYEWDVADASRHRLGFSSRLQLHNHVNLYGRYEKDEGLSSQSLLSAQPGSTQLAVGIESDVLPATQLYSEYRMRGSFTGRNMETASGVRGRYEWQPGLSYSPALEVINAIGGDETTDSVALSLGVTDSRSANRKFNGQAELRDTEADRYFGFRATLAQRFTLDWTGLLREEFTRQTPDVGQLTSRHRFTLGLARRPKHNSRHHMLFLANWKQDFGPEDGSDRITWVLSTHQNRQINESLTISGRAGTKWQTTSFESGNVDTNAMLFDGRTTWDIGRRWELDLRAGWLGAGGVGDGRYSFGAGLAWIADRNLRLGIAYNAIGFRDEDLDEQGFNTQGFRVGLQMKFNEDWFRWLED